MNVTEAYQRPLRLKQLEKVKIKKKKAAAIATRTSVKIKAPISQSVLVKHRPSQLMSDGAALAPLDAKRCEEKFMRPSQYVLAGKGRAETLAADFNMKLESYNTRLQSTI